VLVWGAGVAFPGDFESSGTSRAAASMVYVMEAAEHVALHTSSRSRQHTLATVSAIEAHQRERPRAPSPPRPPSLGERLFSPGERLALLVAGGQGSSTFSSRVRTPRWTRCTACSQEHAPASPASPARPSCVERSTSPARGSCASARCAAERAALSEELRAAERALAEAEARAARAEARAHYLEGRFVELAGCVDAVIAHAPPLSTSMAARSRLPELRALVTRRFPRLLAIFRAWRMVDDGEGGVP
jgi:hypothetical protein